MYLSVCVDFWVMDVAIYMRDIELFKNIDYISFYADQTCLMIIFVYWILIIRFVQNIPELTENLDFKKVHANIKYVERVCSLFLASFFVVETLVSITINVMYYVYECQKDQNMDKESSCRTLTDLSEANSFFNIALCIACLISGCILYIILIKKTKFRLLHFYENYKIDISKVFIVLCLYLLTSITWIVCLFKVSNAINCFGQLEPCTQGI